MTDIGKNVGRVVKAVHGLREDKADDSFVKDFAVHLSENSSRVELLEQYRRFASGWTDFDATMRRIFWRAMTRSCGEGLRVGVGVTFKHMETFEIGNRVFIGDQSNLQGRFDGTCKIGNNVWLGPQSYFDARDLVIEDYVGWGPGAKVLGSAHTGVPVDVPIVKTDLVIAPVRIEAEADIGVNAVILPGVTVGRGSMVGAGAVVTKDVPSYAVVAGVPAAFLRWREGFNRDSESATAGS